MDINTYSSPFADRYSSKEMLYLFSPDKKFKTWRKLWIALAEAEKDLGLPITDEQIAELKDHAADVNYDKANEYEKELKHDVMAHIRAYGDQCPKAKGIIHLGATSAYVVDNTDLIILSEAYELIEKQLINVVASLTNFASKYASTPTVAFTHFQPAQFTTVGKRTCLWIQDLLLDLDEVTRRWQTLRFLGAKGTTGTQASFLELFNGDEYKVKRLDGMVTGAMGFNQSYISGQTYTRKIDAQAHSTLSGIAQSAHKFANDMRLLQHLGEIREPFGHKQVGSSAMAYKRNPMKSERITSLARFVISLDTNAAFTAASQWFERTLDDSAGKRIALPEAFLAVDAILQLYLDISRFDIDMYAIKQNTERELPDIVSENLLMQAVKAGGDRQELHEVIRDFKMNWKGHLLDNMKQHKAFKDLTVSGDFTGRSAAQVREFIEQEVKPQISLREEMLGLKPDVRV